MTYKIINTINNYQIDIDNYKVATKLADFIHQSENFKVIEVTFPEQAKTATIKVRFIKNEITKGFASSLLDGLVKVFLKQNKE